MMASVDSSNRNPFPPDPNDLHRLHSSIRIRKVTTILEFGVGYSTLVMADAIEKIVGRTGIISIHTLDVIIRSRFIR